MNIRPIPCGVPFPQRPVTLEGHTTEVPTINPELNVSGIAKLKLTQEGKHMLEIPLGEGVREFYYPDTKDLTAKYEDGRVIRAYDDNTKRRTITPGELVKDESPQRRLIYKDGAKRGAQIVYCISPTEGYGICVSDQEKNRVKFYNQDGSVKVRQNRELDKIIAPGEGGATRRALPDGTQTKMFNDERILITRHLGPQTKTAELLVSEGGPISLYRKNYKTGTFEVPTALIEKVFARVPEGEKAGLLEELKALQQLKFSKAAKKLTKMIKDLKII